MPGRKLSKEEKVQIRDLISKGSNLQDLRARYTDVNGQSIAGMVRRYGPDGAAPALFAPRALGAPGSASLPPASVPIPPPPQAYTPIASSLPPSPVDRGIPPPVHEDANRTGFTPASNRPNMPSGQGLTPGYAENFIVKKIDAPGDGAIKTERPPFGIQELMDRYPPGEYEIMHYRNGNLYQVYRDKVAPKAPASYPFRTDTVAPPASQNPGDIFMKAIDVYHRMHSDGRRETAASEAVVAQASVAREAGKAAVESTAMQGLMSIVQEVVKPKPEAPRPEPIEKGMVDKLIVMMQEERSTAELKHKHEMERMEKKAELDRDREREQIKADRERYKDELDSREKMQREFLLKMKEVDDKRDELARDASEKSATDVKEMYSSLQEQWNERRRFLDEMEKDRREHLKEVERISRTAGSGNSDIETAKIIKDGIVGGLDRIGARFDMAVEHGLLPGQQKVNGKPVQVIGRIPNKSTESPVTVNPVPEKGGEKVSTKDLIEEAAKSEWFIDLKQQIFSTVVKRIEIEANPDLDPKLKKAMKPNGNLLAQGFIDKMNDDPALRKYALYLIAHDWFGKEYEGQKINGVYDDIVDTLSDAEKKLFSTPETKVWWSEFWLVLSVAWNQSMGVNS